MMTFIILLNDGSEDNGEQDASFALIFVRS